MAKREDNLKYIKKGQLSNEEAKKRGSKGGKKSVEVRRAKKTMKEMLDYLLEKEITNTKGEKASTLEAISVSLIKQAMSGNTKAFEVIRDTIGQKITEKLDISGGLEVQKVFITKEEKNETDKHIDDIING